METFLPFFAEYGLPGLIIGFLLWSNWMKDKRNDILTDKLVDKNDSDAERFTKITIMLERILMAIPGVSK